MSRLTASFRLMRAGFVLAREGVLSALPTEGINGPPALAIRLAGWISRPHSKKTDRTENISRAMNKLGPSYIKLGQFLATRPDIVGRDLANDLSNLQDRVNTFTQAQAIAQIEGSLGRKIDELFVEFGEPIAAASMAQVHPAIIKNADGTTNKVAVKVMRPNVRQRFAKDLEGFFMVAQMQERYIPALRRLRPISVVENLAQTTRLEMDLRLEAAALSEMAENVKEDPNFRVPEVNWERTGRDVLTMEWIDGIKISDTEALNQSNFDLNALAVTLMQSFLRQAMRDGFFHADMHPGNLFVDQAGDIVAVDFGITGRLGKKEKRFLAEMLYGFIKRDYKRIARIHFEAGYVPLHHDMDSFAQANRAIGEPIHGQNAKTISMAKLLGLLFEVTELFDMQTRPELILLQKTMVVVEGVARGLDPNFNMWKASEPVVSQWIAQNLGPIGIAKDMRDGAEAMFSIARQMPTYAKRFEHLSEHIDEITKNGLTLDDETLLQQARMQSHSNRFSRYAIIIMAICAVVVTFKLFM